MTNKTKKRIFLFLLTLLVLGLLYQFRREIQWSVRYLKSTETSFSSDELKQLDSLHCPGCNLLMISIDTVRADRMGFNGSTLGLTPNLDSIAKKSVVFKRASSNAYYTTPSHMTAFTCVYPQAHNVFGSYIFWNLQYKKKNQFPMSSTPLPEKYKTIAEILKSKGYSTHWFAPMSSNYFPLDYGFTRGFDHVNETVFPRKAFDKILGNSLVNTTQIAPQLKKGKLPFYMFLHTFTAHSPYVLESELKTKEPKALITEDQLIKATRYTIENYLDFFFETDLRQSPNFSSYKNDCKNPETYKSCTDNLMPTDRFLHSVGRVQSSGTLSLVNDAKTAGTGKEQIVSEMRIAYGDGIRRIDNQIGELWKMLEQNDLLKNTVVILFSDHGEEIFEHKNVGHTAFYENDIRIPLFMYVPGLEKPFEINYPISLIDIMPVGLKTLGIDPPQQCQGPLSNPQYPQDVLYGYVLGADYIKDQNWKLLGKPDGTQELYYLAADPKEEFNLLKLNMPFVSNKKDDLLKRKKDLLDMMALEK